MNKEYAKHETDYIKRYEELGYKDSYQFVNGQLRNTGSKTNYKPEDIHIVNEHRYEGMSNPSDLSLLYILETSDGRKGTLLAGYGPEANTDLYEFMASVPEENITKKNILPLDIK